MPKKPKKPCTYPGCSELVESGKCEKHRKQYKKEYDKNRPQAHKRGYDKRWEKTRRQFLARNPLCVECEKEGRLTPAKVVDHVIPHKGDKNLFWDSENNWQSLCEYHHNVKTARGE